jgi:hypothetical protein
MFLTKACRIKFNFDLLKNATRGSQSKMNKASVFLTVVSLVLLAGLHSAFATPAPAPAPLLAAGFPAFAALGGGALVARLVRRVKRRR